MSRERDLYITNILFWRPPGNRTPTLAEQAICMAFTRRHIELARPKVLVLAGIGQGAPRRHRARQRERDAVRCRLHPAYRCARQQAPELDRICWRSTKTAEFMSVDGSPRLHR
jgi:uracil-DNA glycosylase family 4